MQRCGRSRTCRRTRSPARPGRRRLQAVLGAAVPARAAAVPVRRRLQLRAPDYQTAAATPAWTTSFATRRSRPRRSCTSTSTAATWSPSTVELPDLSQGALGDGWRQIKLERPRRARPAADPDAAHRQRQRRARRQRLGWRPLGAARERRAAGAGDQDGVGHATPTRATSSRRSALAMQNRYFGATVNAATDTRAALTASAAATEVRRTAPRWWS